MIVANQQKMVKKKREEEIDNSPDKELVIAAVNEISGLYFEYSTYKNNKDEDIKMYLI